VDHSPGQVYVVPGELAQFARAQAKRDRQDEEGFEASDRITAPATADCAHLESLGRDGQP
jgi:hypothetical protein